MRGSHILGGMVIILLSPYLFVNNTFSAGDIPRDGLRLELLLATGAQDTSGNNRAVTSTGVAPTFQVDSTYGVPHAQFSGTGGISVNTAWSATDNFTISFWMKLGTSNLLSNVSENNVVYPGPIFPVQGYSLGSSIYDKPQVIFSTRTNGGDTNAIRMAVSKEGTCSIHSNGLVYGVGTYWGLRQNDVFTHLNAQFGCNSYLDSKWHFVMIQKKAGVFTVSMDGNQMAVFGNPNWPTSLSITKNVTLGGLGVLMDPSIYVNYGTGLTQEIFNSHWYKGSLASFRMYSRNLNTDEIETLIDEYRYAQSDLSGTGNIQLTLEKYSKPNLIVHIKNLPTNLAQEFVEYQYSISGATNFAPVLPMTDISTNTGSISYRAFLDMSPAKDGKVTVLIRVKSGEVYQNLGSITFNKIDIPTIITINQPNSDTADSKTITASATTGAILTMYQTRLSTCDASIVATSFEDYSDLTFTAKSENGIRVCYKAFYPSINKTVYKISAIIQGVQPTEDQKTTGKYDLFNNYTLWKKSAFPRADDTTAMMLDLLGVSSGQSQGTINGVTMTDINGDGLVDFLYSRNDPIRRAIVVNNGNYTFRAVYKCAIDGTSPSLIYYGDCADTTR